MGGKRRYKARVFGRIGGKQECGSCKKSEDRIKSKPDKYPEYQYVSVDTKEGQEVVKKHKVKRIPFIEICSINNPKKCRYIEGYDPKLL